MSSVSIKSLTDRVFLYHDTNKDNQIALKDSVNNSENTPKPSKINIGSQSISLGTPIGKEKTNLSTKKEPTVDPITPFGLGYNIESLLKSADTNNDSFVTKDELKICLKKYDKNDDSMLTSIPFIDGEVEELTREHPSSYSLLESIGNRHRKNFKTR